METYGVNLDYLIEVVITEYSGPCIV